MSQDTHVSADSLPRIVIMALYNYNQIRVDFLGTLDELHVLCNYYSTLCLCNCG